MSATAAKRYYWLRLQSDFFNQRTMKKLRKLAGGDTFTIIYLKLQLMSITSGGVIYYEGVEDTMAEELALVLDEEAENIKFTLIFLEKYGLLERLNDVKFFLPQAEASIGSESNSAARVRRHRAKRETQLLQCNPPVTPMLQVSNVEQNRVETENNNNTIETVDNSGFGVVVELKKFGLNGAAINEICAAIDVNTAEQLIAYAHTNKLGPGWLRAVARDPSKRPATKGSEAAAIAAGLPDPNCPTCGGKGHYTMSTPDQRNDEQLISRKLTCSCCRRAQRR